MPVTRQHRITDASHFAADACLASTFARQSVGLPFEESSRGISDCIMSVSPHRAQSGAQWFAQPVPLL